MNFKDGLGAKVTSVVARDVHRSPDAERVGHDIDLVGVLEHDDLNRLYRINCFQLGSFELAPLCIHTCGAGFACDPKRQTAQLTFRLAAWRRTYFGHAIIRWLRWYRNLNDFRAIFINKIFHKPIWGRSALGVVQRDRLPRHIRGGAAGLNNLIDAADADLGLGAELIFVGPGVDGEIALRRCFRNIRINVARGGRHNMVRATEADHWRNRHVARPKIRIVCVHIDDIASLVFESPARATSRPMN